MPEGFKLNHQSILNSQPIMDAIHKARQNPEAYEGHGIYEDSEEVKEINDGKGIWINRSAEEQDSFEIEIHHDPIASGAMAQIHKATIHTISPKPESPIKTQHIAVRKQTIDPKNNVVERNQIDPSILRRLHELKTTDPEFRVAGLPNLTPRINPKTGKLETRDILGEPKWQELEPHQQVQVLQDVAHTLSILHENGLVHRDIKPANIIYIKEKEQPRGYLVDWDLVNKVGISNKEGTEGYMDMLAQRAVSSPLSDIYALAKTTLTITPKSVDKDSKSTDPNKENIDPAIPKPSGQTKMEEIFRTAEELGNAPEEVLTAIFDAAVYNGLPRQQGISRTRNSDEQMLQDFLWILHHPTSDYAKFLKALNDYQAPENSSRKPLGDRNQDN